MGARMIPNFNQVELAFLTEFAEGTIELAEEMGGSSDSQTLRREMALFQTLLETAFPDEFAGRIIQIEDFRNDLLEIILDRLDDNLNLFLEECEDLEKIGLLPSEAVRQIPEYRSSLAILGELPNGEPDFYSLRETAGHVWNEEHIRMLLNRYESGEYQQDAEILGIAERLGELRAVDHRQELMIQEAGVTESVEELRAIRCRIHAEIGRLYETIYTEEQRFKAKNVVTSAELIIAILKGDQQRREDAKESPNDLSHGAFALLAEEKIPDHPLLSRYKEWLQMILTAESSRGFEENETILYHIVEHFYRDLTIHLLSLEPAQNHPIREKIESDQLYLKALELIEKMNDFDIALSVGFSRGDPIAGDDFALLALFLGNRDYRELLMELRLRPLAEEIVETVKRSVELSALAVRRNRNLVLDQFRQIRADLTAAMQSLVTY